MMSERPSVWRSYFVFGGTGILIGVILLHPAAMFIKDYAGSSRHLDWAALRRAFSFQHLPMATFFGILGAFVGILYAILNARLERFVNRVRILEGILPICCVCKRIRNDDTGESGEPTWVSVEAYISSRTDADFTHTYCPMCLEQFEGELQEMVCTKGD